MWARVVERERALRAIAASGAGLALAFVAGVALDIAVRLRTGEQMSTPIFATARVLADGPGRDYLASSCAESDARYALCGFRALPLDDSNEILWSSNPARGVYTASDYETRVALSKEQWRFVLGAIAHDPLGQVFASTTNTARQLGMIGLSEFRQNFWEHWAGDPWWTNQAILEVTPNASVCLDTPRSCAPTPAVHFFDPLQRLAALVGLALLFWFAWRIKPWRADARIEDRRLAAMAVLALVFLLVNAAVCGALSEPSARYQTRLLWLLPVIAVLVGSQCRPLLTKPARAT